jgi:hypothetical protein
VNCTDGTTINSTSSFFYIQANNIKITNLTLIGDGGDIAFPFEPGIQLNLLVEGNKIQNVYKMITKTGSCALKNMVYARNRIIDCGDECFYFVGNCSDSWLHGGNLGDDYPEGTLFLEDNHITNPTVQPRNLMESGGGGRYTVRHNLIIEGVPYSEPIFGTHGHCYLYRDENTNTGTYGIEVYNNKVTLSQEYQHFITLTGGRGYAYGNTLGGVSEAWNEIAALNQEWGSVPCNLATEAERINEYIRKPQNWYCNAGGSTPSDYPCPLQPKDWYVWNNSVVSGTFTIGIRNTENWSTDYFKENRDYWSDNTSTFTNGLSSNRGSSCTTNNAYFETDTKKLYRCTSTNNYELIYTAYTYPHPLRTGEGGDTYYASPTGGGSTCSLASPCSLATGLGKLTDGDTLYLRGGSYTGGATTFATNGSSSSRITISGYPGETAIIDGQNTYPGDCYSFLVNISGDYVTIQNLQIKNSYGAGLTLTGDYSNATNIVMDYVGETGIVAQGTGNIIDGCTVSRNGQGYVQSRCSYWGSAICSTGTNATIKNSTAYNNRGEGFNSYLGATGTIIQDNISYDNGSVGLYLDSTTYATAQRNLVYYTSSAPYGRASCITVGGETGQPSNLTIINNATLGCRLSLEVDSNVTSLTNVAISNNTFANASKTSQDLADGYNMNVYFRPTINTYSGSTFRNNIVLEDDSNQIPVSVETSHSGLTFSYNNWSKAAIAAAQGTGDRVGDPLLAKGSYSAGTLTGNYFKFSSGAPALNTGYTIAGVTSDFFSVDRPQGAAYDIGAYEYPIGSDTTAPTVSSAAINTTGTSLTLTMSETVSIGSGGSGGFTLSASGGAATLTYASGSGSSALVYTISRPIQYGETVTRSYTQPVNGIEDLAGNDLASFSGAAVTNGSTQGQDLAAPVISSPLPSGSQACTSNPRAVTISIATNETATCRYGTTDAAYDSLANQFATTGGTSHSQGLNLSCGQNFTYYTRCKDVLENKSTVSTAISFSIAAVDNVPPTISSFTPESTLGCAGGNPRPVTVTVATSENSTCRYASTDVAYASMGTTFSTTGGTSHATVINKPCGGAPVTYYVRCQDQASNPMTSSQAIVLNIPILELTGGAAIIGGSMN